MMKKICAILLAFTLIFAVSVSTVAASPFTDIEGADCENAVNVLYALGLVEGRVQDMFAPHVNMTRAEMATVLMRFMDLESSVGLGAVFTDVDASHWAVGNVEAAYGMGIVNGMGDGTFAPDSEVTYAQAVKMFVCALGYQVHAEAQGGYPSGYMAKAAQMGMLKGVSASSADAALTRSDMAILMYNMLELPLLEQTSFGAGASGGYAEAEDKTLMSEYRGIYVTEGVVNATYYTSLKTPERKVNKGEVAIGTKVFAEDASYASELLGCKVKAYYHTPDDSEVPVILYAEVPTATSGLTLNAAYIEEEGTTKTEIEYKDENGKEKSFAIDAGATLVYNGAVKEEWTAADLKPEMGVVTAIDNKGADDIIIVDSYVNYVVNAKNVNEKTVYFKEAVDGVGSLVLDRNNTSAKLLVKDSTGAEIGVDAMAEWDILSVAKSLDGSVIKVVKHTEAVEGKVIECDDEAIVIGEAAYKVDENLPNGSLKAPALDMTATFCLDFMGNIAAVNTKTGSVYKYGYLVGAANTKGIDQKGQLKVFTEDGEMVLFDTADKVIINGDSVKSEEVADAIPERVLYEKVTPASEKPGDVVVHYKKSGSTLRQLIKYRANEENTKILEIITAVDETADPAASAGNDGLNLVLSLDKNRYKTTPYYTPRGDLYGRGVKKAEGYGFSGNAISSVGGFFGVKASTKIFVIPHEDADDSKYEMMAGLVHNEGYGCSEMYDLSESNVVGAMVWDQGALNGSTGSGKTVKLPSTYGGSNGIKYAMVLGTSKSIDEEGDPVIKLRLRGFDGVESNLVFRSDLLVGYSYANTSSADPNKNEEGIDVEELGFGDIITFEVDTSDQIKTCALLVRAATPGMYENTSFGTRSGGTTESSLYHGGNMTSSGIVERSTSDFIIVNNRLMDGTPVTRSLPPTAGQMLAIDLEDETVETITYADVMPGDVYYTLWEITAIRFFVVIR